MNLLAASPLRTLRKSQRLSRTALGSIAGLHPSIIEGIESGRTRNPSARTVIRLTDALSRVLDRDVRPAELFPGAGTRRD